MYLASFLGFYVWKYRYVDKLTRLQHTLLLDSAWLPASQISEKLEILETLELHVNAEDVGIKVKGCFCIKPQLLIPTLSSFLPQPANVPVSTCVQQSPAQAGQVLSDITVAVM